MSTDGVSPSASGVKLSIRRLAACGLHRPHCVTVMFSTRPHAACYSQGLNVHSVGVCVCERDSSCWFIGVIPPHQGRAAERQTDREEEEEEAEEEKGTC